MNKELTKEQRVKKELNKLKRIYKKLDNDTFAVVEGLIHRASYMRIMLEDYETEIDEYGTTELFTQSKDVPGYQRELPAVRLYNTANKNYQTIIKQLTQLLPKEDPKPKDDGFNDFINGRDD